MRINECKSNVLCSEIKISGPPGVGRNELKRRLRASNPNHFEEVVPCKLVISIKLCHNAIRKIHHINGFP